MAQGPKTAHVGGNLRTSAQPVSPLVSSRELARYRWSPAPVRRADPDQLVTRFCIAFLAVVPLLLALEGGAQ